MRALLSSDASHTQERKQHGGRRQTCFARVTPPPVRFFDLMLPVILYDLSPRERNRGSGCS